MMQLNFVASCLGQLIKYNCMPQRRGVKLTWCPGLDLDQAATFRLDLAQGLRKLQHQWWLWIQPTVCDSGGDISSSAPGQTAPAPAPTVCPMLEFKLLPPHGPCWNLNCCCCHMPHTMLASPVLSPALAPEQNSWQGLPQQFGQVKHLEGLELYQPLLALLLIAMSTRDQGPQILQQATSPVHNQTSDY